VDKKKIEALPLETRYEMVKDKDKISVAKQCSILCIDRKNLYYKPVDKLAKYVVVMKKIYSLWKDEPSRGARQILHYLLKSGYTISRKKVRDLMKLLGIESMLTKLNLSKPNKAHKKYPYLLEGVEITHPNHVWSTDITYIKTAYGKVYLTAIIDWFSRKVLSWRLINTLDNSFCIDALNEAIRKYGKPKIFNTDQGSQYTAHNFIKVLVDNEIAISMDGKGRALDNIFIERLWRTVKYEHIFLWRFDSVAELKASLKLFFEKYNQERLHKSLGYKTPDEVYYKKGVADVA
jgi:putative transposase